MCKDALCPHLLLVKEAFPPSHSIGANFNSLSMMGEGDRRLGSVLLLADTLQNESVVEKKKKNYIHLLLVFEQVPEKEVLGYTVPVHLPCALLGSHTPHALAS